MAAMFGAATGVVIHTLLAAFGISALLAASPNAFLALKVAGAIYLLWLAIDAIRNGSAFTLETGNKILFDFRLVKRILQIVRFSGDKIVVQKVIKKLESRSIFRIGRPAF